MKYKCSEFYKENRCVFEWSLSKTANNAYDTVDEPETWNSVIATSRLRLPLLLQTLQFGQKAAPRRLLLDRLVYALDSARPTLFFPRS